ncbi:hypothetical protein IWQ62_000826 [Dispira parvispora]|uniref:SEC7 domain-containing protein n=1 Tax=Dispira parvispora TaxID=1520584 RepID=A0A9W8B0G8_9FUNG|nr:hypothetical protein IWQ62_000826 [Dispira parvispora]
MPLDSPQFTPARLPIYRIHSDPSELSLETTPLAKPHSLPARKPDRDASQKTSPVLSMSPGFKSDYPGTPISSDSHMPHPIQRGKSPLGRKSTGYNRRRPSHNPTASPTTLPTVPPRVDSVSQSKVPRTRRTQSSNDVLKSSNVKTGPYPGHPRQQQQKPPGTGQKNMINKERGFAHASPGKGQRPRVHTNSAAHFSRQTSASRRQLRRSKTLSMMGKEGETHNLDHMLMSPLEALIRQFASELATLGQEAKQRRGTPTKSATALEKKAHQLRQLSSPTGPSQQNGFNPRDSPRPHAPARQVINDQNTPVGMARSARSRKRNSSVRRSRTLDLLPPHSIGLETIPVVDSPSTLKQVTPTPKETSTLEKDSGIGSDQPIPRPRKSQNRDSVDDVFRRLSVYREAQRIDDSLSEGRSLLRRSRSFADYFNVLTLHSPEAAHSSHQRPMGDKTRASDALARLGRSLSSNSMSWVNPTQAPQASQIDYALAMLHNLYQAAPTTHDITQRTLEATPGSLVVIRDPPGSSAPLSTSQHGNDGHVAHSRVHNEGQVQKNTSSETGLVMNMSDTPSLEKSLSLKSVRIESVQISPVGHQAEMVVEGSDTGVDRTAMLSSSPHHGHSLKDSPEGVHKSREHRGVFTAPIPQTIVRRRVRLEPTAVTVITDGKVHNQDIHRMGGLKRRSQLPAVSGSAPVSNPKSETAPSPSAPVKSDEPTSHAPVEASGTMEGRPRIRKQSTRAHPITFYYQPHALASATGERESIGDMRSLYRRSLVQQLLALQTPGTEKDSPSAPDYRSMSNPGLPRPRGRPLSVFASNDPSIPKRLSMAEGDTSSTFIIPRSLASRARKNRFIRREALSMVLLDQVVDQHLERLNHPGRSTSPDATGGQDLQSGLTLQGEELPGDEYVSRDFTTKEMDKYSPQLTPRSAASTPGEGWINTSGTITFGKPDPGRHPLRAVPSPHGHDDNPRLGRSTAVPRQNTNEEEPCTYTLTQPILLPSRQLVFHGSALLILNAASAKQCYLMLFSDLLVVARPLRRPGNNANTTGTPTSAPTLQDVFQVRSVIPLCRAQLRLERDTAGNISTKPLLRSQSATEAYQLQSSPEGQPLLLEPPTGGLWLESRIRSLCRQFETNPSRAILQMLQEGHIPSDAESVASFLHRTTLLNRTQLGIYLGYGCRHAWRNHTSSNVSPYNQYMTREDPSQLRRIASRHPLGADVEQRRRYHHAVTWAFLDRFRYHLLPLDEALRLFMLYIRLPTDPHVIDYLLETFARHWYQGVLELRRAERLEDPHEGNGGLAPGDAADSSKPGLNQREGNGSKVPRIAEFFEPASPELTIKLVYALMTLNSDLHNPLLQQQRTVEMAYTDFITKFKIAESDLHSDAADEPDGDETDMDHFPTEIPTPCLQNLFHRVRQEKLEMAADSKRVMVRFHTSPEGNPVHPVPSFKNGPLNYSTDHFPSRLLMHTPPRRELRGYLSNVSLSQPMPPSVVEALQGLQPATEFWIRIPYPDPHYKLRIYSPTLVCYPNTLDFSKDKVQKVSFYPVALGRTFVTFIPMGRSSRFYSSLPSRTVVVEGGFMEHAITLATRLPQWPKDLVRPSPNESGHDGDSSAYGFPFKLHDVGEAPKWKRYMFGFSTSDAKERWTHAIHQITQEITTRLAAVPNQEKRTRPSYTSSMDDLMRLVRATSPAATAWLAHHSGESLSLGEVFMSFLEHHVAQLPQNIANGNGSTGAGGPVPPNVITGTKLVQFLSTI